MELLVVLAIVGLLAMVALRGFGQPSPLARKRERSAIQTLVSTARTQARLTGRSVAVLQKDLPPNSRIDAQGATELRWFPDGSATPGRILWRETPLLAIDAATGFAEELR